LAKLGHERLLVLKVSILCIIILAAGLFAGFLVGRQAAVPSKPVIGTISLYGYVLTDQDLELYLRSILYASENETVAGLVLRVDSPGGYASMVEDIYNALRGLSNRKPVVAVVEGLAASGGYYATLGANYTYVAPSSFIGNIGVVTSTPEMVVPSETTLETGPFKHTGFPVHDFPFVVRQGLNNFLEAVKAGKGIKLNVTDEELSLGKLYIGSTAVKLGLVDERGSLLDAIAWVAKKANVTTYEVVDITQEIEAGLPSPLGSALWSNSSMVSLSLLQTLHPEPLGVYYLSPYYIQGYRELGGQPVEFTYPAPQEEEGGLGAPPLNLTNAVLIDETHENIFLQELLGAFFGEVVKSGYVVSMAEPGMNLTELLAAKPKAFVIITPTVEYGSDDVKAVKNYVLEGGRLLLIYETSASWAKYMNSLAQTFGLYFSDGYLYNVEENYGIYRNIVVKNFANQPLVANITELTMFTATHIYGNATALASTQASTYLSLTETQGVYTPMAVSGNVTAIADLTFLLDPFLGISDNNRFMENLVENITG